MSTTPPEQRRPSMEGMTDEQKIVHLLDRLVADVNTIKLIMLLFMVMSIIAGLAMAG